MATCPRAHGFFDPLVKVTYSLPKTALVPLFILWFGIGSTTSIVAVAMSTMLPLIVYTYHGVHDTPNILIWSAQAMGTGQRGLIWKVSLRSAQHGILTGLRIGLGFAFLIAIAAEMIAAKVGIGKLLFMYGETGAYDYMFAAVFAVVIAAYAADQALLSITNHCLRWQPSAGQH
ncbi:ABC transporter permease [Tardiphaga sp. vice154]|uniref:ABC transporter permease n=1 Tax=Tardiphaga sp. vice154 TaxID=2592814 RepID=UPI00143DA3F2|nr:ABC transporter permease subunit [Tardiphaga sp. vice154]